MATISCVKYSFCVEWTTQIPFASEPRESPNILLEGVECYLKLMTHKECYYLNIELIESDYFYVLQKFTVTTFIRGSSDSLGKLIDYCQLNRIRTAIFPRTATIWTKSKGEVLAETPNIFSTGNLTIICVFHATDTHSDKNHSGNVSIPPTLNSVHLHSLSSDFSTLLKDETFSDVNLICGDRTFSANRSVLAARSEVFAAMFRNKMAEAKTGVVHIKDVDPELLEQLIKYLYCAEIPDLCEETAHRLYEAADKYAVHDRRQACVDWMVECQTTDNCLDLLLHADQHSDENFKEAVACFVAEHLTDLSFESWSTFRKNYPLLALSVLEKRCSDSMPRAVKRAKTDFQ